MDYAAKVKELWDIMQTNENFSVDAGKVFEEVEKMEKDEEFLKNSFLVKKLKLIKYKLSQKGDLKELISSLEEEVKRIPDNLDVYVVLAEAYIHNSQVKSALEVLEAANNIKETPEVLRLISYCYRSSETKNLGLCLETAKKAVNLDIRDGKSWSSLAFAFLALSGHHNLCEAKKAFELAMKNGQDKNADTVCNYGCVCELLLHFPKAIESYEKAMVMTNGWAVPASNLGRVKQLLKETLQVAESFKKLNANKKGRYISRIQSDDELVIVKCVKYEQSASIFAVCMDKNGETKLLAANSTFYSYVNDGKTIVTLLKPDFVDLTCDGNVIKYSIVVNLTDVKFRGGLKPKMVEPVKISSAIA